MSDMIGVAESCRPISHGDGCPIAAKAALAPESSAAAVSAMAAKREKTFICVSAPCFEFGHDRRRRARNRERRRPRQFDRPAFGPTPGWAREEAAEGKRVGLNSLQASAGLEGIPVPQTTNRGLLQCTDDPYQGSTRGSSNGQSRDGEGNWTDLGVATMTWFRPKLDTVRSACTEAPRRDRAAL